jgi:UPF0716 protein FxsA
MFKLTLLFIVVPLIELFLLIELGQRIGVAATLALIVCTGVLGAWLARRQGLGVIARVREELAAGKLPTAAALDGVLILVAGAVLMTPGVLTDVFGFFCLTPPGRRVIKRLLKRWLDRATGSGHVRMTVTMNGLGRDTGRTVRDITPDTGAAHSADRSSRDSD